MGQLRKATFGISQKTSGWFDIKNNFTVDIIPKMKLSEHIKWLAAAYLTRSENVGRCIIYQQVFLRTEAIKDTKHESV